MHNYFKQLKIIFNTILNHKLSILELFDETDVTWLLRIKTELLRDITVKKGDKRCVEFFYPEGQSDTLLTFISYLKATSARLFLSTEIANAIVFFPFASSSAETIKSSNDTFLTVLQGGIDCSIKGEMQQNFTIVPFKSFYIPANVETSFYAEENTVVWKINIKEMNMRDYLQALITRTMHHHSVMRMGVPFKLTTDTIQYKNNIVPELSKLIELLHKELDCFQQSFQDSDSNICEI